MLYVLTYTLNIVNGFFKFCGWRFAPAGYKKVGSFFVGYRFEHLQPFSMLDKLFGSYLDYLTTIVLQCSVNCCSFAVS